MNMINCIVVDDEQSAIDVLKIHIRQIDYLNLLFTTTKPLEAITFINTEPVQLVFLDIQMPGMTGLELAKTIQGKCKVIFTTGHSEFVSEAFDLEVVDYLLKPISLVRFMRGVQRAINSLGSTQQIENQSQEGFEQDYIFVKTGEKGRMVRIMLAHIDYIEGMKKYVCIHHLGQKTLSLMSMREMEEKLPPKYFLRVQKSFIVALNKIAVVDGNTLKLQDTAQEIIVGEMYKAQFVEAMQGKLK
jgi:two-component system, LytTR family, response regulator